MPVPLHVLQVLLPPDFLPSNGASGKQQPGRGLQRYGRSCWEATTLGHLSHGFPPHGQRLLLRQLPQTVVVVPSLSLCTPTLLSSITQSTWGQPRAAMVL